MILYKNSILKMPRFSVHSVTLVFVQCYVFFGLVSGQGSIQYQSNPQSASPYIVNPPVEIVPYYNTNPYQYQQQQQQLQHEQFGVKNVQTSNYHNVQPLYFTTSQQNAAPVQAENPTQPQPQPLSQIPDTYNPTYNFPVNDVNMNLGGNFNQNIKNNNNIHIIPALTTEYTNPSQPAGLPLYQNFQNQNQNQNQNANENLITQQNAYYQYPNNVNTLIQNSVPLNQNNNVQNIVPIQSQFSTNSNPNPINTNYYVNPGVQTTYANNNNNNNNNNNAFGLGNIQTTRTYFGNFNTNNPNNNNNNNNNIVNSGLQFGPTAFNTAPSTNFGNFGGSIGNVQEYQPYTLNPFAPSSVSSAYNYGLTSSGEQFGFSSSGSSGPSGFPASASSNSATVIETFKALDKTQEFQKSFNNKNVNTVQQQQQQVTEKPKKVYNSIPNGFSNLISITKSNIPVYTKEKQIIIVPKNITKNTTTTTTTASNTKSSQRQNNKNNYKTKEVIYNTKILVNNFTTRSSNVATTTTTTTPKPITKTPTTTAAENIKTTTESIVFGRRIKPIKSIRNRNKSLFNFGNQNDDDDDDNITVKVSS